MKKYKTLIRFILRLFLLLIAFVAFIVGGVYVSRRIEKHPYVKYQEGEFVVVSVPIVSKDRRRYSVSKIYKDKKSIEKLKSIEYDSKKPIAPCFCVAQSVVTFYKNGISYKSHEDHSHGQDKRFIRRMKKYLPRKNSEKITIRKKFFYGKDVVGIRNDVSKSGVFLGNDVVVHENVLFPTISDSAIFKKQIEKDLKAYSLEDSCFQYYLSPSEKFICFTGNYSGIKDYLCKKEYIERVDLYFPQYAILPCVIDTTNVENGVLFEDYILPKFRKYQLFHKRFLTSEITTLPYYLDFPKQLQYRWSIQIFLQPREIIDSLYPDSLSRPNEIILRHREDFDTFLNSNNRISTSQKQKMSELYSYVSRFTNDDLLLFDRKHSTALHKKAQAVLDAFSWESGVPPRDEWLFDPSLKEKAIAQ